MIPAIELNNGVRMPALGLGTWHMSDDGPPAQASEAEAAVRAALDIGYRHIDTAKLYGNERSVGKAVRESRVKRDEVFVATKLWPTDFFNPEKAFEESFAKLDIGYIDLYLVHWPAPIMPRSIWLAMENIYRSGKAKAIGVSNYGPRDIGKLLNYATVVPVVNQIKFSPFDFDKETLEFCNKKGIVIEAYSPLTRGRNLGDSTVAELGKKYGKTAAQIMLRWCIEHGTVPLPKSSNPDRMQENIQIFDFTLSAEDIATLDALS